MIRPSKKKTKEAYPHSSSILGAKGHTTTRGSLKKLGCLAVKLSFVAGILILVLSSYHYPSGSNPTIPGIRAPGLNKNSKPPTCTSQQRTKILEQLTPDRCLIPKYAHFQKCSLTKATKCPKQNWLESYHTKHQQVSSADNFVAIYVGCNKAFDAVNALRMGSKDPKYSKSNWGRELSTSEGGFSVCGQDGEDMEFPLSEGNGARVEDAIVHCLEPVPATYNNLKEAAIKLQWDENLLVTQAAVSKEVGEVYFQDVGVGVENVGIAHCQKLKRVNKKKFEQACKIVPMLTLDHYMDKVAKKKTEGLIDLLSIDVEGFDFDVVLGGKSTIKRTKYLEFEYNWSGNWANQKLMDLIKMLDALNFTCYWAGRERLWRIDESCWLDHYDYHTWSNVACVNRNLFPEVAKNMEEIFLKTLEEKDLKY